MNSLLDTDQQDPQIDPAKNYVEELVGDNKKFKSIEDLARGKAEADAYIEMQNRRMDELREDYKKLREEHMAGKSLAEYIDQIKATTGQPSNRETTLPTETQVPTVIDDAKLESLVSSKIVEYESKSKQERNFNEVKSKLIERFGTNHAQVLKKQIDDLGLSVEDVDALARKSPKAFFKTLGLDAPTSDGSFQAPPSGSGRPGFAPTVQKRTYSFYEKMKKNDPNLYYQPKTQVQMHEDYQALGAEFEDGGFHKYG